MEDGEIKELDTGLRKRQHLILALRRMNISVRIRAVADSRIADLLFCLTVERLPGEPAGTVMWSWLAGFQGAEIGGTAREVFVDGGDYNARVHGFALRLEAEA